MEDGHFPAYRGRLLHPVPLAAAGPGWTAQELLTTFQNEIGEVALVPGTGGVFEIRVGDAVVWSRKQEGRFPELIELKQRLRDAIAPGRDLGHSDRPGIAQPRRFDPRRSVDTTAP